MSSTTTTPRGPPTADTLTTITAQAQKAYSTKDYPTAVSLYATACELQAQLHGSEDDPRNAHLLYLYGKALYQVAVSKSDILGGAAMKQEADADANTGADGDREKQGSKDKTVEPRSTRDAELAMAMAKTGGLFSFQGDENWDNSDDDYEEEEEDDEEGGTGQAEGDGDGGGVSGGGQESPKGEGEGGEAEEDDMANAWEVLDLARVLFHKTLDPTWAPNAPLDAFAVPTSTPPSTLLVPPNPAQVLEQSSTTTTTLKTQLADVYDLLGEISLESEAFNQAVDDLRSSLQLKLSLFPPHGKLVSEAHYKLSLALEFASAMEGVPDQDSIKLRHEAVEQMSLAIESVKKRIVLEEQEKDQDGSSNAAGSDRDKGKGKSKGEDEDMDKEKKTKSLQEAREIVAELEQRLVDLRALLAPTTESQNPLISDLLLKSILGTAGESSSSSSGGSRNSDPAEQKRRLDETVKQAKDVSNLVRKKPKPPPTVEVVERGVSTTTTTTTTSTTATAGVEATGVDSMGKAAGKRKLEDIEMSDVQGKIVPIETNGSDGASGGVGSKKVKVEDSLDEEERDGGSAAIS